jgi:hypothetical protein
MMLKDKLRGAVRRCSAAELDEVLGMDYANAVCDLEATLHHTPTSGLERLQQAILHGNVVRNSYRDSLGRGCLMHWLWGATNNETLWAAFSDDARLAEVSRTVRFFDRQSLSLAQVQRAVNAELARRSEVLVLPNQPPVDRYSVAEGRERSRGLQAVAAAVGSHLATPV